MEGEGEIMRGESGGWKGRELRREKVGGRWRGGVGQRQHESESQKEGRNGRKRGIHLAYSLFILPPLNLTGNNTTHSLTT